MALGPNDLKTVVIPTAWDGAELSRLQLADGTSYANIIGDLNAAIGTFNAGLASSYWANLLSVTEEAAMEYGQGAGNAFEVATEYGQPDAQRGDTSGHMLPMVLLDYKLGWTSRWLEEARRPQIDNDINAMLDAAQNSFEQRVLTRLFKLEEETGRAYGLGASGYSVPFCDGGNGTIAYTPRPRFDRATAFASSHNHYLRLDGITQANVETAVKHLWEHGYDQPFDLLGSLADSASWVNTTNVTGFRPRADILINYGADTSQALVNDEYIGVIATQYGTARVKLSARIPTTYWGVIKIHGPNDPRNALRVRVKPGRGLGLRLMVDRIDRFPLAGAIPEMAFGVGVGMRESAVLVKNASSSTYSTPTIS